MQGKAVWRLQVGTPWDFPNLDLELAKPLDSLENAMNQKILVPFDLNGVLSLGIGAMMAKGQ